MTAMQDAYDALCAYTLARADAEFIHQHVVDSFTAQQATDRTKPVALTFALVGLYLVVERQRSGRQVQQVHVLLGRRRRRWPTFDLPLDRGAMSAIDVMTYGEGPERDRAIRAWCEDVWAAYAGSHRSVRDLLGSYDLA